EAGPFARETPRTERRKAPLVRQLGQWIRLVHELGELRAPKELFDRRHHRADVDQCLWCDDVDILNGHALAHDSLHARESDAKLVLQKLPDGLEAAIAQVIDVVDNTDAVHQSDNIVDCRDDIVPGERLDLLVRSTVAKDERRLAISPFHHDALNAEPLNPLGQLP